MWGLCNNYPQERGAVKREEGTMQAHRLREGGDMLIFGSEKGGGQLKN